MTAPDHIIVGSGINALVCAALLARKGGKVLVLERNDRIGGCIRTEEITAPGFVHDVMATTFVLFITSPAYAALAADLGRHGLEFCNTKAPTGVLRPDGSHLIQRMDRQANIAAFDGDGAQYAADVGDIEKNAGLLFGLLGGGLWTYPTFKLLAGEAWRRKPRALAAFLGDALVPARGWLESSYKSDLSRALWAPWVLHAGLGPEDAFSGQIAKVIAFALEAAGAPIVKGGAKNLLAAFEAMIKEKGGEIRTGADVASVIVEGGRATGVRLASGETITASKSVVCSVTPTQLYERLLEQERAGSRRRGDEKIPLRQGQFPDPLRARPPAGLARSGPRRGCAAASDTRPRRRLESLQRGSSRHTARDADDLRGTAACARSFALPARQGDSLAAIARGARHIKGDAAGKLAVPEDGKWTDALREAYADRAEAILASHIDALLGHRARPPRLFARRPGGDEHQPLGGDPYGGSSTIDQSFLWRPFKSSRNHETSIKGLYHIGASTHPGAGLGGGSGFLLAQRL